MKEEWKDLEYAGMKYSVSSTGRIYSYDREELLPQWDTTDKYFSCKLGSGKTGKSFRVHRLVAQMFVHNPNPTEYVEVNHLDFDRKNNRSDNLEWCTHSQNVQYSIDAGRMNFQINDYTGSNNPNYGNRKLSKIYSKNLQYAKEKQGRPGKQNGRCVPVRIVQEDGNHLDFSYMRECADYLIENGYYQNFSRNWILLNIVKSIKNEENKLELKIIGL